MNKKKITITIGLFLFVFLPVISFAFGGGSNDPFSGEIDIKQQGIRPVQCCVLKHKIRGREGSGSFGEILYEPGYVVGPPRGDITTDMSGTDHEYSGDKPGCPFTGSYYATFEWAGICTINTVATISDWIMWIAGILSVLVMMISGILYMTSGGNPEKMKKAGQMITYALVGIGIAIGSRLIPSFLRYLIGI